MFGKLDDDACGTYKSRVCVHLKWNERELILLKNHWEDYFTLHQRELFRRTEHIISYHTHTHTHIIRRSNQWKQWNECERRDYTPGAHASEGYVAEVRLLIGGSDGPHQLINILSFSVVIESFRIEAFRIWPHVIAMMNCIVWVHNPRLHNNIVHINWQRDSQHEWVREWEWNGV
jgi:hypothetical protein